MIDSGAMSMELGGKELKATILFADIRNFTSISEKHTPSEILTMLNEYFTEMAAIIFRHGGMIDKYIGDAIMAVFGVPQPGTGDAQRAVTAAREMHSALLSLNERLKKRGADPIHIGVGLHTGIVVAGNIGSVERMEYTVIGDTVNVTSRLEGLNKVYSTGLLFSEKTKDEIDGLFKSEFVARAEIRGKSEAMNVYTIADPALSLQSQ
ncbi:MAG TPA: hypothetical protein DEA96_04770 [Leptospiraceae bacterium]|nr:hypothetical protein [Leptospiraceae bacterium]